MPYLDFTAGQILTATQVDDYLMRQSVMVFDDSSARSSAIGTVVTEGMVTYLKDINSLEVTTDGTAFVSVNNSTINNQAGTAYTCVATDAGKLLRFTSSSAATLTVDNVLVAGQRIDILQDGAGAVTVSAGSGVTLNGVGNTTAEQYAAATILCVASGQYRLVGALA